MLRIIAPALAALALAVPARALDAIATSKTPGAVPAINCALAAPGIAVNGADGKFFYCDGSAAQRAASLLNALPSGRKAVEQGRADDLTVLAEGADTARSEAARAADTINAKDYTTFAGAVNKAQTTGKALYFPAGSYTYLGGFLTVTADVIFETGAQITCNGNLGFTGAVTAPPTQIFAAGCKPSFYSNTKVSWGFPEWWGAKGDSNLTPGNGTDNAVPLQAAIDSGVAGLQFAGGASYRYTVTPRFARINFAMKGVDRTTTRLALDDVSGTQDGFFVDGTTSTAGGITLSNIDWFPLRPAKGGVEAATVVAGGTGHAVNDILTIPGGTCTTQPQLKVATVTGSAVATVTVQTPGVCTRRPLQTATLTTFPANAQGTSTGAGTGATFDLRFRGPASVRIRDAYFVRIDHSFLGGANGWDGVRVEQQVGTSTGKIYISDNVIQNMGNNGVTLWGPSNVLAEYVGDVSIDSRNYIQYAGHAGVEARGNVGGIFVFNNLIFANQWGIFWNGYALNGSNKIRANDIDTDYLGTFLGNYNSSHFQQNWVTSGGPLICTLCAGIVADGNAFVGKADASPGMSQLWLNGTVNWAGAGSMFNGVNSPVQIGSWAGTASRFVNITGATHAYASGHFATLLDTNTIGLTVGVQMDNTAFEAVTGTAQKLTVVGQQSTTNIVYDPRSAVLWGMSNQVGQSQSAAGGYGNASNGYANLALGHSNIATGSFSQVRGWLADDNGLFGADCWASGSPDGSTAGLAQACQHVLYASSTSTAAKRLTADGAAAGAANCLNLPNGSHAQMEVRISGRDTSQPGVYADWASSGVTVLDRGASAAATTYSGSFSTATVAQASAGAGSTAQAQLTADTTNGCLNITVTPPNANAWRWVATVRRLKMR